MRSRSAGIAVLRGGLTAAWVVAIVGLIGLAAWGHVATVFVVRGSSMEPTIPIGSLVTADAVSPAEVERNDILVIRADNGAAVTHRVVRVLDRDDGRYFEMKGDANVAADPALVPAAAIVGRVEIQVPRIGYLLALLSTVSGLVAVLSGLAMLLVAIWWLDDRGMSTVDTLGEVGATRGVAP